MGLTVLLIRHGNTFDPGDTVLRVGLRTDLPLSSSGRLQAEKLGQSFKDQNLHPTAIFTSELQRTRETAELALTQLNLPQQHLPIQSIKALNEIDYGIDDGQPESRVIERLGAATLEKWETQGLMPDDWAPRPPEIVQNIKQFKSELIRSFDSAATTSTPVIWVVTSNGISRFFTRECQWMCPRPPHLRLSTGAMTRLEYTGKEWQIKGWNIRPE